MSNKLLKTKPLKVFLKQESSIDAATFPLTADGLVLEGDLTWPAQPDSYEPIREIINSFSATALMKQLRVAGTISFNSLSRPSGTAGTAPAEGVMFKAMGLSETVVGAVSVTYAPTVDREYYSLWIATANGVLFCTGLMLTSCQASQGSNAPIRFAWTGKFARLGWAAETTLGAEAADTATTITLVNAKRFALGAYIDVGVSTDHNITAIDYETNIATVDPAISGTQANGLAVVASALPTPTAVGDPSLIRPIVSIDGTAVHWESWSAQIDQAVDYIEDEVTPDPNLAEFPTDTAPGDRTVTAEYVGYLRTQDLEYLRGRTADESYQIDAATNAAAGSKLDITLSQGRFIVPAIAAKGMAVGLTMPYSGYGPGLEDEIAFVYT